MFNLSTTILMFELAQDYLLDLICFILLYNLFDDDLYEIFLRGNKHFQIVFGIILFNVF